jgi:F-type H+-transporting ATPase subunit b
MEFHPVDILISLINIVVLFILLRLILWKYIFRFLSARADRVRAELDDVEARRQGADALRLEYEEKIESIEERGRDLMRESQIKASEEADEIIREARENVRVMLNESRQRIEEERERAIENAHHDIAQIATDMAARILRREVSHADSKSAVDHFFSETETDKGN